MDELLKKSIAELTKDLADKREGLRAWRFGLTGSKVKNMKEGSVMKKDIARILTGHQQKNRRRENNEIIMKTTELQKKKVASNPKVLSGTVVSAKMKDTVVVKVERFVKNSKYQKFVKISKRYKAHDEGNTKKVGEKVDIVECRPLSKDKHFKVLTS